MNLVFLVEIFLIKETGFAQNMDNSNKERLDLCLNYKN